MKHLEDIWITPDAIRLFTRTWLPDSDPQGTLILVHGLGEHSGRYQHVAEFFTAQGYSVYSFDLRGHGRSQGIRGHADSFQQILQDIDHFVDEAQRQFPHRSCFLYGHSLGGSLVLTYVLCNRSAQLSGVIVSSPGLSPARPIPRLKMALAKLLSRLAPAFLLANDLDFSGLSRTPGVMEAYLRDPLVHDRVSARLGLEILNHGAWLQTQTEVPLPVLLMQGSADRLVDAEVNQRFASRMKGDFTFRLWEGLYHELHNEPEKDEVLAEISAWMTNHQSLAKGSPHADVGFKRKQTAAGVDRQARRGLGKRGRGVEGWLPGEDSPK